MSFIINSISICLFVGIGNYLNRSPGVAVSAVVRCGGCFAHSTVPGIDVCPVSRHMACSHHYRHILPLSLSLSLSAALLFPMFVCVRRLSVTVFVPLYTTISVLWDSFPYITLNLILITVKKQQKRRKIPVCLSAIVLLLIFFVKVCFYLNPGWPIVKQLVPFTNT